MRKDEETINEYQGNDRDGENDGKLEVPNN
jgi:hypothetical protein